MIVNKVIYTNQLPTNQTLEVNHIKTWLADNQNYFHFLINESNCRKWSKWVEDKSTHIYPCACPIREQDCIFIETYYELEKVIELHKRENYFKSIVCEYNLIKNDSRVIKEWIEKYLKVDEKLFFKPIIEIKIQSNPSRSLMIKLSKEDFKNLIEFQNIFNQY